MKYLKFIILFGCITQITNLSYAPSEQVADIAYAEFGAVTDTTINEVINQAKLLAAQQHTNLQNALNELQAEYSGSGAPAGGQGKTMKAVNKKSKLSRK